MISIVVPVFRSAENLTELYRRIKTVFDGNAERNFELILVEDCGGDGSWEVIQMLAAEDMRVRGISMSRNYGQHNALLCGIREATGHTIVTLDDDLQHPPEEISKLLLMIEDGYDVVYGSPEYEQHGMLRDIASIITKMVLEGAMGARNAKKVSAFRAFKRDLREAFCNYSGPTVNIDVLLTWATTKFASVRVRHDARKFGESGYTVSKLISHALNMMTGFSTRPLQYASLMGFCFALFGMLILIYVITKWILGANSVPGFAFLASIITIFAGAQLIALGVIGEYVARMHTRTMDQPSYVIREETRQKKTQKQ